jgi:hypothetical protein
MIFLAACGGGGTGSSTPTPTSPTPTPSPTTPSVALQTFTGDGFTISYPASWQKSSSSSQNTSQTVFQDATTGNSFTIVATPDPGGALSADSLANTSSQALMDSVLKNGKSETVPTSVTINGVTWSQRGASGDVTVNGQSVPAKLILLVTVHPANATTSRAFQLIYAGPALTFDMVSAQIFQPMLQSFKFTS